LEHNCFKLFSNVRYILSLYEIKTSSRLRPGKLNRRRFPRLFTHTHTYTHTHTILLMRSLEPEQKGNTQDLVWEVY